MTFMKCLTLYQEYAWGVCFLGKDWENRCRPPSWYGLTVGDEFAIHSGAHLGGRKGLPAAKQGLRNLAASAQQAGVNVKLNLEGGAPNLVHWYGPKPEHYSALSHWFAPQHVVAVARLGGWEMPEDHPKGWRHAGQYGFKLVDIRVLSAPVSCSVQKYPGNRQGLWNMPGPVQEKVEQLLKYDATTRSLVAGRAELIAQPANPMQLIEDAFKPEKSVRMTLMAGLQPQSFPFIRD